MFLLHRNDFGWLGRPRGQDYWLLLPFSQFSFPLSPINGFCIFSIFIFTPGFICRLMIHASLSACFLSYSRNESYRPPEGRVGFPWQIAAESIVDTILESILKTKKRPYPVIYPRKYGNRTYTRGTYHDKVSGQSDMTFSETPPGACC